MLNKVKLVTVSLLTTVPVMLIIVYLEHRYAVHRDTYHATRTESVVDTPGSNVDSWSTVMIERRALLLTTCHLMNNVNASLDVQKVGRHILVVDRLKMMFCEIPKVASSTLRSVIFSLQNNESAYKYHNVQVHSDRLRKKKGCKFLSEYSADGVKYRLKHYKRIITVRDPLQRVVSAYRNKFVQNNKPYRRLYGRLIIKKLRVNATEKSVELGNDVTLEEFVKFLISGVFRPDRFDPHWRPYFYHCSPCKVKYDYIMKTETLNEDLAYLEKYIARQNIDILHKNVGISLNPRFVARLPEKYVKMLKSLYSMDYKLFGYS